MKKIATAVLWISMLASFCAGSLAGLAGEHEQATMNFVAAILCFLVARDA